MRSSPCQGEVVKLGLQAMAKLGGGILFKKRINPKVIPGPSTISHTALVPAVNTRH
ncbi:hypothetical protein D3C85_1646360 [compost metagenome]